MDCSICRKFPADTLRHHVFDRGREEVVLCAHCRKDKALFRSPYYVDEPLDTEGIQCLRCGDHNLKDFTLIDGKPYCDPCTKRIPRT